MRATTFETGEFAKFRGVSVKEGIVDLIRTRLAVGDLRGAGELVLRIPEADQQRVLHSLADDAPDSLGIAVYGLVLELLCFVGEDAHWHGHASALLATALCWVPGAYALGYHHACRVAELNPNDADSLEFTLLFADGPNAVVSTEEARAIAVRVLEMKPESEIAKRFIPNR